MNNKAKAILWMGLFMVIFGVVKNWSVFSSQLFGGKSPLLPYNPNPGQNLRPGSNTMPLPSDGKCPKGWTKVPVPNTGNGGISLAFVCQKDQIA